MKDIRLRESVPVSKWESGLSQRCCIEDCSALTKGGKCYCQHHVAQMPYAAKIMDEISAVAREVIFIEEHKFLPEHSICLERVTEILNVRQRITVACLAQNVYGIPVFVIRVCINHLHGEGLLAIGCGQRKQVVIEYSG